MALDSIVWLVTTYKYGVLFPLAVVEGPVATVIAGFLSSLGYLNPLVVYGVVVAGDLTGDALYYLLGRYGRQWFVGRWGSLVGITPERLARLEQHFTTRSGTTLILGKLSHAIGGAILMAAGMAKMPWGKFMAYNLVATLPKSLLLLLIGYYFGQAYAKINRYLDYTAFGTVAVAIALVLTYMLVKTISKRYEDSPRD